MKHVRFALTAIGCLLCGVSAADDASSQSIEERLTAAAIEHRLKLDFDGEVFSGPAWDRLVSEGKSAQFFLVGEEHGKSAQFFLVGEEHGIAENPMLVSQLFVELSKSGYSKMAIEISPTMASRLDAALVAGGLDELGALYAQPGGEPAFFGMAEEVGMLVKVRAHAPKGEPLLWGTDYEVASDRQLIALLQDAPKPAAAKEALDRLAAASTAAWATWKETGSPQYIFAFAGDPALVTAIRDAWPGADEQSAVILNTLEQTLSINRHWMEGRKWESNAARANLQRENFLRHWQTAKRGGKTPRVLAKYGSSHMVRGISQTAVYDLGTLLPEIAALEGGRSVSMMVLPGMESKVAALNPANWSYESRSAKDNYARGLESLTDAAFDDTFTLIDLAALRPIIGMRSAKVDSELFRIVHGFDLLLVMSGSTPSGDFEVTGLDIDPPAGR